MAASKETAELAHGTAYFQVAQQAETTAARALRAPVAVNGHTCRILCSKEPLGPYQCRRQHYRGHAGQMSPSQLQSAERLHNARQDHECIACIMPHPFHQPSGSWHSRLQLAHM